MMKRHNDYNYLAKDDLIFLVISKVEIEAKTEATPQDRLTMQMKTCPKARQVVTNCVMIVIVKRQLIMVTVHFVLMQE